MKTKIKHLIILIFSFLWTTFIFTQIESFQITSNTSKNVRMTQTEQLNTEQTENNEQGEYVEYTEYTGILSPRQNKIRTIELRFSDKTEKESMIVYLEDSMGNAIFTYEMGDVGSGKKISFQKTIPVDQSETYTLRVKVMPAMANGATLKTVHIKYQTFMKDEFMAAAGLMILTIFLCIFKLFLKKDEKAKLPAISYIVFLFLTSMFAFWMMEYIFVNDIWNSIDFRYIKINWLLYGAVYATILILTNSYKVSAFIGTGFFFVWAMANQYVYMFKGQPLQPVDLKAIRTAADVASEYDYTLTAQMIVVISALILFALLWSLVKDRKLISSHRRDRQACRLISGGLFVILIYSVIFQTALIPNLSLNLDMWDTRLGCERHGTALAFFGYWRQAEVQEPENYDMDNVATLAKQYKEENELSAELSQNTEKTEKQGIKPNIVVVMNEAFADLSYLGDFKTNIPYLSNYDNIMENAIKGNALVSIYGGGTPNSEFEFLTGHSLGFLPGSIPFAQHIQEEHLTMASNLKAQGYETWAMHPMQGVNWRRNVVYPYLGFEQSVFIDEMGKDNVERIRNYTSDKSTYDYVMKLLKEKEAGTPAFIFDVTVQNHSGFTYSGKNYEDEVFVEGFDSSEVNQYLTLIKKSDEALGMLIEELKNFDEPTMLVFYGDHNPRIPEDFYRFIMGEEASGMTLEAAQKKFTVPFMIWTNYEMPENDWMGQENLLTSLNFLGAKALDIAGVKLSGYDRYRLQLEDMISAMNLNGYVGKDGLHHTYDEENEYIDMLNRYWQAEYNEMFDGRNKVKEFFVVE